MEGGLPEAGRSGAAAPSQEVPGGADGVDADWGELAIRWHPGTETGPRFFHFLKIKYRMKRSTLFVSPSGTNDATNRGSTRAASTWRLEENVEACLEAEEYLGRVPWKNTVEEYRGRAIWKSNLEEYTGKTKA